ncbi:hypothetical protein [Sphingomonas oryzagri]
MRQQRRSAFKGDPEAFYRFAVRIGKRLTWRQILLWTALYVWILRPYSQANLAIDAPYYELIGLAAIAGCWTMAGWLLALPAFLFPDISLFRRLSTRGHG